MLQTLAWAGQKGLPGILRPTPEHLIFGKFGALFSPVHPDGEDTTSIQGVIEQADELWVYKVRAHIKKGSLLSRRIRASRRPERRLYFINIGVIADELLQLKEIFAKDDSFTGPTCASGFCRIVSSVIPDLFMSAPISFPSRGPRMSKLFGAIQNIPSPVHLSPAMTASYLYLLNRLGHPRLGQISYYGPEGLGVWSPNLRKETWLVATAPFTTPFWWWKKFGRKTHNRN